MKHKEASALGSAVVLAALSVLAGCSPSSQDSFCDAVPSVAGFVVRMSQGLDNFSEDQYFQLRSTALSVYDTVQEASDDSSFVLPSEQLLQRVREFNSTMDDLVWDVSVAVNDPKALEAASTFTEPEILEEANNVESYVIEKCGLPKFQPNNENAFGTLPLPYIASPTATEPPTGPINQESENIALGTMVGTLFGLTLTPDEVKCVGEELQDIVDVSSASSNAAQYLGQYQRAFDTCQIDFKIPLE